MGVSVTLREITIYGYKRLAVFLLTSRFIGLTSVSQGKTLFCLVSTKEFPVITMTTVLLYTLQNLCAPLQTSLRLLGFRLRETLITSTHFFNHYKAYYGQMKHYGQPGAASPPL